MSKLASSLPKTSKPAMQCATHGHEQCNEAIANRFLATVHVQQLGKLAFLQGMST
jgi:hypothetical protein